MMVTDGERVVIAVGGRLSERTNSIVHDDS